MLGLGEYVLAMAQEGCAALIGGEGLVEWQLSIFHFLDDAFQFGNGAAVQTMTTTPSTALFAPPAAIAKRGELRLAAIDVGSNSIAGPRP